MTRFETNRATLSSGWIEINPDSGRDADVYVKTGPNGMSCKRPQIRDIIEELAKVAGFPTEPTGNGMGILIQFPESEAVQERRDELAYKFFDKDYDQVGPQGQHAIEFIIDGEKKRGELR